MEVWGFVWSNVIAFVGTEFILRNKQKKYDTKHTAHAKNQMKPTSVLGHYTVWNRNNNISNRGDKK